MRQRASLPSEAASLGESKTCIYREATYTPAGNVQATAGVPCGSPELVTCSPPESRQLGCAVSAAA